MAARKTIYDLLKKEHQETRQLLNKLMEGKDRERTFRKLHDDLMAHAEAEEKVLYRRLRKVEGTHREILESIEEHRLVKNLLRELDRQQKDSDRWMAKVSVLKDLVEKHIEEEEGALFPSARKVLDSKEEVALAQAYKEERQAVTA